MSRRRLELWQVRFPDLVPESSTPIPNGVNISIDAFSLEELTRILKKLKHGKASGHDNVPPEFWKFVVEDSHAMSKLLGLCNHCWETTDIPNVWRVAKVILLFKKGDATLPQNYRPISLLPVGYKVLAALIHQRLLDNGVDSKICRSQYGFRPHRSCCDALMVIRRMIDVAHESNYEGLMLVFFAWAKLFDE